MDALGDYKWKLTAEDQGEAEFVEQIQEAIRQAMKTASDEEENAIRDVFG